MNHEEGRVVLNKQLTPEYQYMLKDHLGNVRVTFTSTPSVYTFTATMETNTQTQEQADFGNYSSTVNDMLDHTDVGTTYTRALVLNGGYNGQVGLAKSFAVMPGDVISAKVHAKYMGSPGQASALGSFAAALTGAFGLTPPGIIDGPSAYSAINDIGGILATGNHPGDDDADPKGFINVLVSTRTTTWWTLLRPARWRLRTDRSNQNIPRSTGGKYNDPAAGLCVCLPVQRGAV